MANKPADIANQALDACGFPYSMGDIQDGTEPAQIILRAYRECRRQLLRAVHWNFARQQTPLVLLADATGNTPTVPNITIQPWIYEYALPDNCVKVRFVPWTLTTNPYPPTGNIVPPNNTAPVVSGLGNPVIGSQLRPTRFLETMDPNFAQPPSALMGEVQGISPGGRTVICTNVQWASLVFTADMIYPANWDSQFRAAFVAFLASEIALPLWSRKGGKFIELGMKMRDEQIKIAAMKIMQARVTDGNEGWHSSEFVPDWFRYRNSGGGRFQGGYSQALGSLGNEGIYYGGLDACCGISGMSAF